MPHIQFRFSYSYARYWDWSHLQWYLYWKVLFWYELGLGSQRARSPLILQGSPPFLCLMACWCISVISQNPTVPRIYRVWLDLLLWWEYRLLRARTHQIEILSKLSFCLQCTIYMKIYQGKNPHFKNCTISPYFWGSFLHQIVIGTFA